MLGVTEPFSCGIGGGGFMVIRTAKGKVTTIDGREKAPAAMRPDSFFENGARAHVQRRPLQRPLRRRARHAADLGRARCSKYGTISLAQALQPGIDVARGGFDGRPDVLQPDRRGQATYFDDVPSTAAIYLDPDGTPQGRRHDDRNPDMAKTYRIIGRAAACARASTAAPSPRAIGRGGRRTRRSPPTADHTWRRA